MAKSHKNRINSMSFVILISFFVGLLSSIFFVFVIKGTWFQSMFIIISTIISSVIVKIILDLSIKRLASNFSNEMERIKQGDFSHLIDSRSYDILSGVASIVNVVLSEIRSLIDNFFTLSKSIVQASRKVSNTSQEASAAMEEISKTVDEIAKGASSQAEEAQQGVQIVEKLSEQINFVYESYDGITQETKKINELNNIGMDSVNVLREKSEENFNTSERIFAVVEKLTNTTKDIGLFVESIESIAEQTNLLALNAAIEAARAGEAGRGFAVVAEEVRILADQSRKSTEEINNLMESIQAESLSAIQSMDIMKKVTSEQNKAVNKTDNAFNDIANAIKEIVTKITEVNVAISKMQADKTEVIAAIENISSVSQQTAASSQQVAATTEHQLRSIGEMKENSEDLDRLVQELDVRLKKYKLR